MMWFIGVADEDEAQVTPLEAVILNAIMTESATFNIKVNNNKKIILIMLPYYNLCVFTSLLKFI